MSSSSHPSTPQPSTIIAERYRLESLRAHGGMADVWQATDLQLTRTVAIKLLKPHLAAESTLAERFRREAIAAANLNHYNIVTVYDAGKAGDVVYIVSQAGEVICASSSSDSRL